MIKTRLLCEDDLNRVAEIERLCFTAPWSVNSLGLLLKDGNFGVVAEEDGVVAAYVGMVTVPPEGEITNVAVHPDFRRRGMASALLERLIAEGRARRLDIVCLEVRPSNVAAVSLYKKKGFLVVGERRGFYSAPRENALLMNLALQDF